MVQSRDFIETFEGLLFAAINSEIHFLRYYPAAGGGRMRRGASYAKVASTDDSFNFLEDHFPEYIFKRDGLRLQRCPPGNIKKVFRPAEKLHSLRSYDTDLAKKCTMLSDLFHMVPAENKGVTGSILVDLATPDSDIDFVVYGLKYFDLARRILQNSQETLGLDRKSWKQYYQKRFHSGSGLGFDEWLWHEKRKFNLGRIEGTLFNLLLVGGPVDLTKGAPVKKTVIRCKVLDSNQSFSVPAVYKVEHKLVDTVVSFTHTYAGQALEGERIEVSGMLEKTASGWHRMVVGTSREAAGEYIKVVRMLDKFNKLD